MKYYWIDCIDDFLNEKLIYQWVSEATISTYTTVFNLLLSVDYIDIFDLNTLNEINFKRFLSEKFLKNKWSSHTYNRYRKNLKCFCDYLIKNNHINHNPLLKIPIRLYWKKLPKTLSKSQMNEIFYQIENLFNSNEFISLRNKTLLYFYIYTWCRLKEVINLTTNDIDFQEWIIRINSWKWNKDRLVPLANVLANHLQEYLNFKNSLSKFTEILFPTRFLWYLQHRDIYNIFDKLKKKVWFNFTPHMFRHTFATELVRKNLNIYSISKILWHSNLKTTQIYIWLDVWDIKENIDLLSLYK